jgi:hypothetical protein
MGAFDGYWIPSGIRASELHVTGSGTQKQYQYFSNQSSFEFFKGFEMPELKSLLAEAERGGCDTVWVPNERPGNGHKGLHTWYVRALINEYDKE